MYLEVGKGLNIQVLDSLNFLPMKLAALPKAFGLKELKKGYFPHFFNTTANQKYVGPYPDPHYYGIDYMSVNERREFLTWYDTAKNDVFDFGKEMLEYCRSDVDILRQACLSFRTLLMESTGKWTKTVDKKGRLVDKFVEAVDPFDYVTIASVCMGVYKTKFLEETWRVKLEGEKGWFPAKLGSIHTGRTLQEKKRSSTRYIRQSPAQFPERKTSLRPAYLQLDTNLSPEIYLASNK
ncbi:hypothetical protein ScPMuIL_010542 [Solemya velum]